MDRIYETVHYEVYDIHKRCNMAEFGRRHIPGFKPESGCGFFEFKQQEYLKPHKAVILVDKVSDVIIMLININTELCKTIFNRKSGCSLELELSSFVQKITNLLKSRKKKLIHQIWRGQDGSTYSFRAILIIENCFLELSFCTASITLAGIIICIPQLILFIVSSYYFVLYIGYTIFNTNSDY